MTTLHAAGVADADRKSSSEAPSRGVPIEGRPATRTGASSGSTGQSLPAAPALAAGALLEQCRAFVDMLTDEVYRAPSRVMMGSTIGQHVRHSLDHFGAAVCALSGAAIDYDHRERDTPVETCRDEARARIAALRDAVGGVTRERAAGSARVLVMLSGAGEETELGSTIGRELAFAAHHATHHHAMMAAIAKEHGVTPPPDFGKAPSTLHHERAHGR